MRPKIMPSHNISRSINYNEQKVTQGKAECLTAANFLKPLSRLSVEEKLHCFKHRMELNDRVKTSLHITLNFDPSDRLPNEKMKQIADSYMQKIGFGQQPYLVYRHNDAGHPHCHIVTTHVRSNGDPIDLYNIGRNRSEKARQYIEETFELVTAEAKKLAREQQLKVDGVQRVTYGKGSMTSAISNVLEHVTKNYLYASFDQFNAILRCYNIQAYRGTENTQLYRNRGLLYRVLDENGRYIGRPLKASFFDCKPTLDNLQQKFVLNLTPRQKHHQHVMAAVLWSMYQHSSTMEEFHSYLYREGVQMLQYMNAKNRCEKVIFIDFRNKAVFNCEELDERCNVKNIQQMIDRQKAQERELSLQPELKQRQRLRQSF